MQSRVACLRSVHIRILSRSVATAVYLAPPCSSVDLSAGPPADDRLASFDKSALRVKWKRELVLQSANVICRGEPLLCLHEVSAKSSHQDSGGRNSTTTATS